MAEATRKENEAGSRIRHYACERCAADLAYQPGHEELSCAYCGFRIEIELNEDAEILERDLEAELFRQSRAREEDRESTPEDLEVRCPSCHAEVVFQGILTAQSCAYCDGPIQRSDVHRAPDRVGVDALLPFSVESEDARAAVVQWLGSLWFAPDRFKAKRDTLHPQSLYLPYWCFDALTSTRYRGRTKKTKQTFWRRRHGSFQWAFDDVMVVADQSLRSKGIRGLQPWPLDDLTPYDPRYLAGHLAKTYDVDLIEAWKRARKRIESDIEREVLNRIGGDRPRIDDKETRWDALKYRHFLLPVYLVSIRDGERVHQVVVSGATGKIIGERPYSVGKIVVAAAAAYTLCALAVRLHGLF